MPADPIAFQPRRFRSAVAHYPAGRAAYPARLITHVLQLTGLNAEHDVLDLGCGPGQLGRAFAPHAKSFLGVDPEPEMLALAQDGAPANTSFIVGTALIARWPGA